MNILNEVEHDYRLDRVPILGIEKFSKKICKPFILVIIIYIIINQGSLIAKSVTFVTGLLILFFLHKLVYKLLVFSIGVPATLLSNLLPIKRKDRKFIEYAYEHLEELYVKKLISKKYYEEGIQYIEELEDSNI